MTVTIRCIYQGRHEPRFPSTDQHPDAARYVVRSDYLERDVWVDAVGGEPTTAEVDAVLTPREVERQPTSAERETALRAAVPGYAEAVDAEMRRRTW